MQAFQQPYQEDIQNLKQESKKWEFWRRGHGLESDYANWCKRYRII